MREYELTVVYDLAVAEAGGNDAAPNHVDTLIAARGGKVLKHDHWGRRRMAYPINRTIDADYVVSRVEIDPSEVTPLEAAMRIDERIYRHLIVRADELPPPPAPREPRRMPADATAEGAPAEAQPAASVAGEAAVAAPSPVAQPEATSGDTVESVVAAIDPAAITPAASEAAEPLAEVEPVEEADAAPEVEPVAEVEPAAEAELLAPEEPEGGETVTEAAVAAVESEPTEAEATAEAGTDDEAPSA